MLRSKERHGRIGNVTLEDLRAPVFPVFQKRIQRGQRPVRTKPSQHFARGGWRTRPRIEQREARLPSRERLIENRKIRDHDREKREACSRFGHRHNARETSDRLEIAQTQGEERRPAHVEIVGNAGSVARGPQVGAGRPMQPCETRHQPQSPQHTQS